MLPLNKFSPVRIRTLKDTNHQKKARVVSVRGHIYSHVIGTDPGEMALKHIPEDEIIGRLFLWATVSQVYTKACNRFIRPNQGFQKRFLLVSMKHDYSLFYKAGHVNNNPLIS